MRIGVDVRMLESSGIGRVIQNILIRMIKARPEWEFYLIGRQWEIERYNILSNKNVHVIDCDSPIYSLREQLMLLIKIPRNLDVFWSPHYNVPVLYRGRLIVTIHDLAHLALPSINSSIIKRSYAKTMFKIAARKASNIICVSNFTKNELIKYVPDVKEDKISVIYNGVDDKWKHIPKGKSLHTKPYFLCVGNIKPHKNLRRLIAAYRRASDELPQDLILIGKKAGFITKESNLEESIKGYEDRIIFTGYVSDEILMQYVSNAEAVVFPSFYEGFGLPPIEALAAGKKVLASKVAAIPEICSRYVKYFDPYDVNDIANALLLKDEIPKPDETFFAKYNWDDKCNRMLDLIEHGSGDYEG